MTIDEDRKIKLCEWDADVLASHSGNWRRESSSLQTKRAERRLADKSLLKFGIFDGVNHYLRTEAGDRWLADAKRVEEP